MNFRDFVSCLEFKKFDQIFDVKYEIAAILKKFEGIPVNFLKQRIVGNLFSRPDFLVKGINLEHYSQWIPTLIQARKKLGTLKEQGPAPDLNSINLEDIPILTHFGKDAGPYITSGAVIVSRENRRNASIHRILPISDKKLTLRIVRRHLYEIFMDAKEHGEDLPVAVCIGMPPAVQIASSTSLAADEFELEFAASLNGGSLNVYKGLPDSEIIIRGKILQDEVHEEGPFLDITGTYDIIRKEPVLEIEKIDAKSDFIYHALLPASNDHVHLMGLPRIPFIHEQLIKRDIKPLGIYLPPEGFGWLTCLVSVPQGKELDVNVLVKAILEAHYSVKRIVILDDDVDLTNSQGVQQAITLNTKFTQKNPIVLERVKGSSLDPRADGDLGSKIIIDARKPSGDNPQKYERGKIPVPSTFLQQFGADDD